MRAGAGVLLIAFALLVASCSSDDSGGTTSEPPGEPTTSAPPSSAAPRERPATTTTTTAASATPAEAVVITCAPGTGADFSGQDQASLNFEDQSVRCASFDGAALAGVSFVNADATGASFVGATISNSRMDDAVLIGADFSGATLSQVRFTGADLRGADLRSADVSGVRWGETICPDGLTSDASGGACDLTRDPLPVTVDPTDTVAVAPIEFKPLCAPDSGEDFSGQELAGEDFRRADLRCASFVEATINGGNFRDADASAADFTGATISEATFDTTALFGTSFAEGEVTKTQFRNANLIGADLTGATFNDVRWINTICPNGVNSDVAGGTCVGSLNALDLPEVAFAEISDGDITVRQGGGLTTYTITNDVLFEFDSDALTAEAEAKLDLVVASIAQRFGPRAEIQVWGHADAIGDEGYNLDLSQRRADNVAALLSSQPELDGFRIVAVGLGESQPLVANTNPDGSDNPDNRAQNRRVEIVVPSG